MRRRTGQKATKIADAALELFLDRGIAGTSMGAVARAAGVATGTLYLYYQNKDEVIVACAEKFAADHLAHAEKLLRSRRAPARKLKEYVLVRFDIWRRFTGFSTGAVELREAVLRLRPAAVARYEEQFLQTLAELIAAGVASGRFRARDPGRAARNFALSVAYFFPLAGTIQPRTPGHAELSDLLDWLIDAL